MTQNRSNMTKIGWKFAQIAVFTDFSMILGCLEKRYHPQSLQKCIVKGLDGLSYGNRTLEMDFLAIFRRFWPFCTEKSLKNGQKIAKNG